MFEKLHIKITILAALIATIYCITFVESFTNSCVTIIATISVFYIISGFITINLKKYNIDKQNASNDENKLENEENTNLGNNDNLTENTKNEAENDFNNMEFNDISISN